LKVRGVVSVPFFCPQTPNIGGFWRFHSGTIDVYYTSVLVLNCDQIEGLKCSLV
jgi:hypothetical protein